MGSNRTRWILILSNKVEQELEDLSKALSRKAGVLDLNEFKDRIQVNFCL